MAKPIISKGMVRRKVREVCNMASGHGKTEEMLLEFVNELTGGGVDIQMLRDALEWNLSEGFLRYDENTETEETEWFITRAGQAEEGIK
jgi:hypothetical protein